MGATTADHPCSPLNPHRTLVSAGDDAINHGQLTFRSKTGASLHIRVVQETVREDLNMRRVRWCFTEGTDKFEIELKHGRTSGLRKIYVNQVVQERIKSLSNLFSSQESTHEFALNGETTRAAKVLISKNGAGWAEYTYQLLIDDQPIQLIDQTDTAPPSPVETRALSPVPGHLSHRSAESPPTARRSLSFSRRRSSASQKALAAQLACFHVVRLDKSKGEVGICVSNSERVLASGKRRVGVVLIGVAKHSIAAQAGLQVGDVIMAVNDKQVDSHQDAIREVDASSVLQLKVWGLAPSRTIKLFRHGGLKFGVSVADNEVGPGVMLSALDNKGIFFRQGLRVGDVVLSINDQVLDNHEAAVSAIDQSKDEANVVYVPGWREAGGELADMEA